MTREIIQSDEMKPIWDNLKTKIWPEDIVKLAVGKQKAKPPVFNSWELILSKIITGNVFGVDRIDYLLRDSYHTGVAYGRFDHYRLIDTLRILPDPISSEPKLGIEVGGLHTAEALLLARYFMYTQVYFHPVRRIYDRHLMDFLKDWLDKSQFSTMVSEHLKITDNEVSAALLVAAENDKELGHSHADYIINRKHFKLLYESNTKDSALNSETGESVYKALSDKFGKNNYRHDRYRQQDSLPNFPVLLRNGDVVSSLDKSEVLNSIPVVSVDYVFCKREKFEQSKKWLEHNRDQFL